MNGVARKALIGLAVLALTGLTWAVGVRLIESGSSDHQTREAACDVHVGSANFLLELDQAEHAATIAAVGKRMGLPDRAVTIALAVALQESGLHNFDHGDRDSLGLFQQRPSQGWGTPAEILTPSHAAETFFVHLARVDGWESAPVTVAAQEVQRSATPTAYAAWEPRAVVLTQALTGAVPAAIRCQFPSRSAGSGPASASSTPAVPLDQAITQELGSPALGAALSATRGWTVSAWLVAHAQTYGITSVAFAGRTWMATSGTWSKPEPVAADSQVRITTS